MPTPSPAGKSYCNHSTSHNYSANTDSKVKWWEWQVTALTCFEKLKLDADLLWSATWHLTGEKRPGKSDCTELPIVSSYLVHVMSTTRFLRHDHIKVLVKKTYSWFLPLIYGIRNSGQGICILNKFLVWFLYTPKFEDFWIFKNPGTMFQALFHTTAWPSEIISSTSENNL